MFLNPDLEIRTSEAAVIGRILTALGELEYILCKSVAERREKPHPIFRALYRISGTSARIEAADALGREIYAEHGMGDASADANGALRLCAGIRNQYAHCAWANGGKGRNGGFYFADLALSAAAATGWDHTWRLVNVRLLRDQYAYFEYVKSLLFHLETGSIAWRRSQLPLFPWPPKRERPPLHNPPERHIPQWISEADRQRHLKAAREAKETVRSQERAHLGAGPNKPAKLSRRQIREKKVRAALRKHRRVQ